MVRIAVHPSTRYALCMVLGAYIALRVPELPPAPIVLLAGLAALVSLPIACARDFGVVIGTAAFVWWAADRGVQQKLPPKFSGTDQTVVFRILSVPELRGAQVRFVAEPLNAKWLPNRVRLSWYDAEPALALGQCWQLGVRLRRPRGFLNPGGFDYEAWLFARGIGATGYVRTAGAPVACPVRAMATLRRDALSRLRALLPDDQAAAVLQAITVGARDRIADAQWQRFAMTGTGHLMAISGMHVGLAAGTSFLVFWGASAALRSTGNHRIAGAAGATLVAAAYVLISGSGIPARRALTMLLLVAATLLLRRTIAPLQVFGLTVMTAVVAAPLDLLSPGFKLSFAAVLLLIWQAQTQRGRFASSQHRLWRALSALLRLQYALLLGLLPLTAGLFGRLAWSAPVMNVLVVPLFNAITVPTALLGLSLAGPAAPLGDPLLKLSWHSVRLILALIDTVSRLPHIERWVPLAPPAAVLCLVLALAWVVLPGGWPGRRAAWLALVALVVGIPQRTPPGCVDAHILDVGQGLAAVLATPKKTLVFDTGPAFRSGSDTGRLVVVPFLRWLGRQHADVLVLSHGDLDHVGGVDSLIEAIPVSVALAGESEPALSPSILCSAGQLWYWDEIEFRVLHPGPSSSRSGNNASCVLSVRAGQFRLLLTGDIEKRAEASLLHANMLERVDAATVPHHGSSTSSRPHFVDKLSPRYAIVSAGYENRWQFPRLDVVARWQKGGAKVINTARSGAVSLRLCAQTGVRPIREERRATRRLWHDE